MKFEVTTMLPVHTTAVKLNCCLARGYWYRTVGFQLNEEVGYKREGNSPNFRDFSPKNSLNFFYNT